MSNHARGLWGYTGHTPGGRELTIQATGMGGPSAAIVLADLAELGLRRSVRVGTCVAIEATLIPGELLLVREALTCEQAVAPHPELGVRLAGELAHAAKARAIASLDRPPSPASPPPAGAAAADMQTATVLAGAPGLGIAAAAVLIVEESAGGERIGDSALEEAAKRAGAAASASLSS